MRGPATATGPRRRLLYPVTGKTSRTRPISASRGDGRRSDMARNVMALMNRRRMMGAALGFAGLSAAGAALVPAGVRVVTAGGTSDHAGHATAVNASQQSEPTADEMDAMHEAGVKA